MCAYIYVYLYVGTKIISRDYLTVKVWDVRNEKAPAEIYEVHPFLRSKLCDLYENDCIFDKFECSISGDGKYVFIYMYKVEYVTHTFMYMRVHVHARVYMYV